MITSDSSLPTETKPLALVLFCGEELWANLHALVHWQKAPAKLQEVFLGYALEEPYGQGQAQWLQRFIERHFSRVRVALRPAGGLPTPQHIQETVRGWMSEHPGRRWLLNATGGSRAVALGLAGLAGQPAVQVIHRETSDTWFELARPGDSNGIEAQPLEGMDLHELDALPAAELAGAQFGVAADELEVSSAAVEPLPVKQLTVAGIAQGWNWPAAFSACGFKREESGDALFAHYVGAGLRELGVSNLARHVRLIGKRDRKPRPEIDLVASHAGKLLVMDLKARNELNVEAEGAPIVNELRQALEVRQRLQALAVQVVLVRPVRLWSGAERSLAKACGVEVIDQRDAPRVFSRLAALLRLPPLPTEMADVEAMLVEQVTRRGRLQLFASDDDRLRQQETDSGGPECVDIEAYLNRLRVERGQNWLLWASRTEIGLRLERPADPPAELPTLIEAALSNFGHVRVEFAQNGYEAIFLREPNRLAKLRQALAGFVNRRLETLVFVQVRPQRPATPTSSLPAPKPAPLAVAGPALPLDGHGTLADLEAALDLTCRAKPAPRRQKP